MVSIQKTEKRWEVSYLHNGKSIALTGALNVGYFEGITAVGKISLATEKLAKLTFEGAPKEAGAEKPWTPTASIILADGGDLKVSGLLRVDGSAYPKADNCHHYPNIKFDWGESSESSMFTTVEFDKLEHVEFQEKETVRVSLKDGTSMVGRLRSEYDSNLSARFDGLTGQSDKGTIYVSPKRVKAIVFGTREAKQ